MRMKRARGPGDGGEGPPRQPERPMSWEGELMSDTEMSIAGREDERMDVQSCNDTVQPTPRISFRLSKTVFTGFNSCAIATYA